MNAVLHITSPGISFIGSTELPSDVQITQANADMDGIAINADNITLKNLSIHNETDGKVALTVAGCNYVTVYNCYIYGNATTFSVYFAGPQVAQGAATLLAYYMNQLNNKNVFKKNVVYSKWAGDAVAFCLQNKGKFSKNIVRGGKVSIYMCQKTKVSKNNIIDSTTSGFFMSLPLSNIKVVNNSIRDCTQSAIVIRKQMEHGDFVAQACDVLIDTNTVLDCGNNGIELNDCISVNITNNMFNTTTNNSLYALRCNDINVQNNMTVQFTDACWLENTSNSKFQNNVCYSTYPNVSNNFIKLVNGSCNNIIQNNSIKGSFSVPIRDTISVSSDSLNNVIASNNYMHYYDYNEELIFAKKCHQDD